MSDDYREPLWTYTTLIESMFFEGITSMGKALTLIQLSYILEENETNTTLILNHLVSEKFFKNEGFMYYLDKLGIFHAKKRIDALNQSVKDGKVQDWQLKLIEDLREKFRGRIRDVKSKKKIKSDSSDIEDLKKRVTDLEEKFDKMKGVLE